jgi:ribonuclease P protein component
VLTVVRARVEGETKVAVVAGKAVGSAVERNRAKRRIRAALRVVELPAHEHIAVLATQRARTVPFEELVEVLTEGLSPEVGARA